MSLIEWVKMYEDVQEPEYQTAGSSGMDIKAYNYGQMMVELPANGGTSLIHTGLKVKIARGYEIQIRPRSSLALKHGIIILNSPGTIDSDYEHEIGIILCNLGSQPFQVNHGDRVAQAVISKVYQEKKYLKNNKRNGGFGSTGK